MKKLPALSLGLYCTLCLPFVASAREPAVGDIVTLKVHAQVRGSLHAADAVKEGETTQTIQHSDVFTSTYTSTSKWEVVGGLKANSPQLSLRKISDNFSVSAKGGGSYTKITIAPYFYSTPKVSYKTTSTTTLSSRWQLQFPPDSHPLPWRPILSPRDKTFQIEVNGVEPDSPELEGSTTHTVRNPDANLSSTIPGPVLGSVAMAFGVAAQNATIAAGDDPRLSGTFDPSKPFVKSGGGEFRLEEDPAVAPLIESLRATYSPNAVFVPNGRLNYSYTLAYNCEPADVVAEIVPAGDYERWLPAAATAPGALGNTAAFTLRLVDPKTKAEPKDITATFEIQLPDTSAAPGTCGNSPWEDAKKDVRIEKDQNPDLQTVASDGQSATSKAGLKSCPLTLSCFDSAAFTRFKVIAHLSDGQTVPAHLKGKEDQTLVALPLDENDNRIADAWEAEHDVAGQSRYADDDNAPVGDGTEGDGLTNHEEYRGFFVNGKHIRTDPHTKDLFLYNGYGADAEPGIALFEKLTELAVHSECTAEELPESRLINRNHGSDIAHKVEQHGVRIITGDPGMDPVAVATDPTKAGIYGPPRMTQAVQLPAKSAAERRRQTAGDKIDFRGIVAHELCHAVGVDHHGDMLDAVRWAWIRNADRPDTWQLYEYRAIRHDDGTTTFDKTKKGGTIRAIREADGSEWKYGDALPDLGFNFDAVTHSWELYINFQQGVSSGCETCVMRYGDAQAYMSTKVANERILPDHSRETFRDTLCDSSKGTGVNSPHNKPQSRAGDAKRGNCKSQIIVNDR